MNKAERKRRQKTNFNQMKQIANRRPLVHFILLFRCVRIKLQQFIDAMLFHFFVNLFLFRSENMSKIWHEGNVFLNEYVNIHIYVMLSFKDISEWKKMIIKKYKSKSHVDV